LLDVEPPKISKYPPHVKDILLASFPPKEADSSLWKNFKGTKYTSPAWNGVHGSFWSPPLAAPGTGGFKIASPMPAAPPSNKIIAKDLPAVSISGSSFDLPKRKDIVQIDLPISRQKKIQYQLDPHKINNFERTSYFGSARTIKPKPMSLKRFLQVDLSPEQINSVKNDALTAATSAESKAANLSGQITKNPFATSMIIPIVTTNLQEQPSLKIDYKNV
jgi:hypothetical protein